jgi:hypothetical protein
MNSVHSCVGSLRMKQVTARPTHPSLELRMKCGKVGGGKDEEPQRVELLDLHLGHGGQGRPRWQSRSLAVSQSESGRKSRVVAIPRSLLIH